MTFNRKITLIVVVIIFVAIFVTGSITSFIINNYFKSFISDVYEETIEDLMDEAREMIVYGSEEHNLNRFLEDPITGISISYASGDLLYYKRNSPMGHGMRNMPMFFSGERDSFDIVVDGVTVGTLVIERSTAIQDSQTVVLFNRALIRGVFIAGVVALSLSLLLSRRLSRRIVSDLKETSAFANSIETGNEQLPSVSSTLEIQGIQRQLVILSRKLKMQNRVRKAKVDQISHETKTPITILKSQLEGAVDGVLRMDERRIGSCLEAVDRLDRLTQNITSVLELDADDVEVSFESFDLMEELRTIQTGLSLQFSKKGIELVLNGPEMYVIKSDKNLLTQSLYNLIINGLKFTNEGSVTIEVDEKAGTISVSDTGIGITEVNIGRIFEPYYRAVSKETFAGDGLGLYIVMRNITAIGAEITVDSQQGKGTVFEVKL